MYSGAHTVCMGAQQDEKYRQSILMFYCIIPMFTLFTIKEKSRNSSHSFSLKKFSINASF